MALIMKTMARRRRRPAEDSGERGERRAPVTLLVSADVCLSGRESSVHVVDVLTFNKTRS